MERLFGRQPSHDRSTLPTPLVSAGRTRVGLKTWRLGYATNLFWSLVSRERTPSRVIWLGDRDPYWESPSLMISELRGDSLGSVDTVTHTLGPRTEYAGCSGSARRWAGVADVVAAPGGGQQAQTRLFFSDSARSWHEVAGPFRGRLWNLAGPRR